MLQPFVLPINKLFRMKFHFTYKFIQTKIKVSKILFFTSRVPEKNQNTAREGLKLSEYQL